MLYVNIMPFKNWSFKYKNSYFNRPVTQVNLKMSSIGIVQSLSDPNVWIDACGNSFVRAQNLGTQQTKTKILEQRPVANTSWQDVKNKRKRSPEEKKQNQHKQAKLRDYWLATPNSSKSPKTSTSNRFDNLDVNESDDEMVELQPKNEPKPPPIFVDGVSNLAPLNLVLKDKAKNGYELKVLNNECVKIQIALSSEFTDVCRELESRKTQFHTYQLKKDRNFRVVLKNLHHSSSVEELRSALKESGHNATNIHNMKQRGSGKPSSMFCIELETNDNNKSIYGIDLILNQKVKFEPPHKKREIPQCSRCQRYGHTKGFCNRDPRCVKCTGGHSTEECPKKERTDNVKCVLCEGNHPANYKGCAVYKQLQEKKFPALRKKQMELTNEPKRYETYKVQPGISYAQIAREQSQQVQFENNRLQPMVQSLPHLPQQSNDMLELKSMMKGLMEQMGTMLNLLTTLVSKMA